MTVAELIEKLKQMPQNAQVRMFVYNWGNDNWYSGFAEDVLAKDSEVWIEQVEKK